MSIRFLRLTIALVVGALPFVVHAQGLRYPRPNPTSQGDVQGPASNYLAAKLYPRPNPTSQSAVHGAVSNYLPAQRYPRPNPTYQSN